MNTKLYWLLVLLSGFIFSSCAKNEKAGSYDFTKFASNVAIEPTENCGEVCTYLKTEFRYLVYVGEKMYCYWDEKQAEHKLDFKKSAIEFENQISDKTSDLDYFMLLARWASLFKDGHVNAMLKADTSEIEFYGIGVRFEVLAPGTDHETLIVSNVGSSVRKLRAGVVVNKIQGIDWKILAHEAESLASGSTLQMRRRQVGNLIARVLLEKEGPVPVKIEGEYSGQPVTEVLSRNLSLYDASKEPPEAESTGIELIKSSIVANNIGYLRIDGFEGTSMAKLLSQAMDRLSRTSALLIDVRYNGGGDLSGNVILSRLTSEPIARFHQRLRNSDLLQGLRPWVILDYVIKSGDFSEMISRMVKPADDSKLYKKPVMVLTSSYCFSACDTFVSAIQENKLGVIVGESTGGGTGNPQFVELPFSENSFRYSVVQGFTAVGKKMLEGIGTQPDVILEPTVEERVLGRDTQLEKAIIMLSEKISSDNNAGQIAKDDAKVVIPDSLLSVKLDAVTLPVEIERDREMRRSRD